MITAAAVGVVSYFSTTAIARASAPEKFSHTDIARLIQEDSQKPPFQGTMNGIVFKDRIDAADLGCAKSPEVVDDGLIEKSAIDFSPTDLPEGARLVDKEAFACDGNIVLVSKTFKWEGGELEIVRSTGTATIALAPKDRIRSTAIGTKGAVLITQLPVPGVLRDTPTEKWRSWRLIVRQRNGMLELRSHGLPVVDGIKIAQRV